LSVGDIALTDLPLGYVYTNGIPPAKIDFSWDEKKRAENWRIRRVDFAEAVGIFDGPQVLESTDDRGNYGETRIQALGETNGVFYLVVYTWRG
jgi:uncharacterized DUF497 family protein